MPALKKATKAKKMNSRALCLRGMLMRMMRLEQLVLVLVSDRLEASDLIYRQGQQKEAEDVVKQGDAEMAKEWRKFYLSRGHYREMLRSMANRIHLDEDE